MFSCNGVLCFIVREKNIQAGRGAGCSPSKRCSMLSCSPLHAKAKQRAKCFSVGQLHHLPRNSRLPFPGLVVYIKPKWRVSKRADPSQQSGFWTLILVITGWGTLGLIVCCDLQHYQTGQQSPRRGSSTSVLTQGQHQQHCLLKTLFCSSIFLKAHVYQLCTADGTNRGMHQTEEHSLQLTREDFPLVALIGAPSLAYAVMVWHPLHSRRFYWLECKSSPTAADLWDKQNRSGFCLNETSQVT